MFGTSDSIKVLKLVGMLVCRWGFRGWSKGCTMVSFCCACRMLLPEDGKPLHRNGKFYILRVSDPDLWLSCLHGPVLAYAWYTHALLVCSMCQRPLLATRMVITCDHSIGLHHSDMSVCCCNAHVPLVPNPIQSWHA